MCYIIFNVESKTLLQEIITPYKGEKLMATKKNYHYVLVFTNDGPVYVTSVNNAGRYSVWDKSKAPLSLPKYYAEDIVFGLNCNYHNDACNITSRNRLSALQLQ